MKKKRLNNRMYITLAVLTLAGGGGASYLQIQNLGYYTEKAGELRAQLAQQGDVQNQLDAITQKVQDSQEKLNHLEQGAPQLAYMPTLMTEIEALGLKNGVRVTGVRPMPAKFAPPKSDKGGDTKMRKAYEEQDVEVKGSGHYLKVLSFLSELEKFPKIVSVQTVTLSPKNDLNSKDDVAQLDVTIEIKAFLFPTNGHSAKSLTQGDSNHEGV